MANREDEFVAHVGRRLGALRVEKGVTQQELADRLDTALKNLQRIEAGRQNLTLRTIFRVTRALGVSPESAVTENSKSEFLKQEPGALKSSSPLPPRPVPIFRIEAAAGFARDGQLAEVVGWAILPQAVDERHFICRVAGDSMQPDVPSGSWNLFKRSLEPPTPGKVVLVELDQSEVGGRYVLKRLDRMERRKGALKLVLSSRNPAYAPLTLESSPSTLRLLAEHVAVLRHSL